MKILFISHNATLTGAPIVLLTLLQKIRKQALFDFDVLLLEGGELETEFRKVADVTVLHQNKPAGLFQKILNRFSDRRKAIEKKYVIKACKAKYQVIYANTIASLDMGTQLKANLPDSKLVLHLHELQYVISETIGKQQFKKHIDNADRIITVSKAVSNNLVNNYNFDKDKLQLVYAFSIHADSDYQPQRDIRKALNISPDTFLVGASGEIQWRKGYDLFIQLAAYYRKNYPNSDVSFVWIGQVYPHQQRQIEYDLEKANLTNVVKFVGKQQNPKEYYAAFDVLAMVSREDPFPLVCIEAAALSKPIVCFENAGGIPEMVEEDGGFVVPYCDIQSMAEKIHLLQQDRTLCSNMGSVLAEKTASRFSKEKSINAIIQTIQSLL